MAYRNVSFNILLYFFSLFKSLEFDFDATKIYFQYFTRLHKLFIPYFRDPVNLTYLKSHYMKYLHTQAEFARTKSEVGNVKHVYTHLHFKYIWPRPIFNLIMAS